jgi:hypothetical protein
MLERCSNSSSRCGGGIPAPAHVAVVVFQFQIMLERCSSSSSCFGGGIPAPDHIREVFQLQLMSLWWCIPAPAHAAVVVFQFQIMLERCSSSAHVSVVVILLQLMSWRWYPAPAHSQECVPIYSSWRGVCSCSKGLARKDAGKVWPKFQHLSKTMAANFALAHERGIRCSSPW